MSQETQPALKEIFNRDRLRHLASITKAAHAPFDEAGFMHHATQGLDDLGIMQRMRQVAVAWHAVLPGDYNRNIEILSALAPHINHGFTSISLAEYVALYGQDHFEQSMQALQYFTRFGSSEFAIRHFLAADMPRTLAVMQTWAFDKNEHVRRLSSEGCRPRLPWSFQLKALVDDPSPVMPILENLKSDPSLYVRKSVANHLNDITKDNPAFVLQTVQTWPSDNPHTTWIIRQALRTLIKKGDVSALAIMGVKGKASVEIERFQASPETITLGNSVQISATIKATGTETQKLVIDYALHYVKKAGSTAPKVFKWKELHLKSGERADISINRAIRDFTTRTHYPGHHGVDLLINGEVKAQSGFTLTS
jgi:3-methyladenine DNA glycosylase AlkC